jgi:Cu2+-exporting ATPase
VSRTDRQDRRERRSLLMRMAVAMLGMMQVMMYAWPLYTHEATIDPGQLQLMRWASFALTIPVVLYSASPIFAGAWRSLRQRHMGMDVPVAIGVLAGFRERCCNRAGRRGLLRFRDDVRRVPSVGPLSGVACPASLAQWRRDAEARQLPATCERLVEASGVGERIPVARLNAGDRIRVKAGEIMPADGVVVAGVSEIDESMLTGEARPVKRHWRHGAGRLLQCCQSARGERAPDRRADPSRRDRRRAGSRAGGQAPSGPIGGSRGRLVCRHPLDPGRNHRAGLGDLDRSITRAAGDSRGARCELSLALSLATPAVLAAAGAALSRRGVLLTRAHTLEARFRVSRTSCSTRRVR